MCVLTRDAILEELEAGRLRIEPFDLDQIGTASIDLHLGDEIRVPRTNVVGPISLQEESDPHEQTDLLRIKDVYVLEPGRTIHGVTVERLELPPNLCGWLEGRSRTARFGLTVHATSGFVHPGVRNHQVLEMTNVSQVALALHPGIRICQIVLERTEGCAVYQGRFANQTAP
jgi:dCTP deaminase